MTGPGCPGGRFIIHTHAVVGNREDEGTGSSFDAHERMRRLGVADDVVQSQLEHPVGRVLDSHRLPAAVPLVQIDLHGDRRPILQRLREPLGRRDESLLVEDGKTPFTHEIAYPGSQAPELFGFVGCSPALELGGGPRDCREKFGAKVAGESVALRLGAAPLI